MAQIGWSSATGESSAILNPALAKGVRNNYGRWENEEFNELIQGALSTVDLAEYDSKLKAATAVAMEELPIIPTHFQVVCWGHAQGAGVRAARRRVHAGRVAGDRRVAARQALHGRGCRRCSGCTACPGHPPGPRPRRSAPGTAGPAMPEIPGGSG